MKYIIEIKPEYEDSFKGVMILGAKDSNLYVDSQAAEELEELNSDYINEHFCELQNTAYQKGLEYAWEAAKKLFSSMADSDIDKAFPIEWNNGGFNALMNLQPQEAIAKLKAYEEKQKADDKIEVGDEVAFHHDDGRPDTVVVVTYIGQDGFIDGMDGRGTQYAHKNPTKWTKTGRHFDIKSILDGMRCGR